MIQWVKQDTSFCLVLRDYDSKFNVTAIKLKIPREAHMLFLLGSAGPEPSL